MSEIKTKCNRNSDCKNDACGRVGRPVDGTYRYECCESGEEHVWWAKDYCTQPGGSSCEHDTQCDSGECTNYECEKEIADRSSMTCAEDTHTCEYSCSQYEYKQPNDKDPFGKDRVDAVVNCDNLLYAERAGCCLNLVNQKFDVNDDRLTQCPAGFANMVGSYSVNQTTSGRNYWSFGAKNNMFPCVRTPIGRHKITNDCTPVVGDRTQFFPESDYEGKKYFDTKTQCEDAPWDIRWFPVDGASTHRCKKVHTKTGGFMTEGTCLKYY